jgi:hypothetical protein
MPDMPRGGEGAEAPEQRGVVRGWIHKRAEHVHNRVHHVCNWVLNQPCNCYATHDAVGCDSLGGQLLWVFGSCRAWYGEPCAKTPPPPIIPGYGLPPGYGPKPGYGPNTAYGFPPPDYGTNPGFGRNPAIGPDPAFAPNPGYGLPPGYGANWGSGAKSGCDCRR